MTTTTAAAATTTIAIAPSPSTTSAPPSADGSCDLTAATTDSAGTYTCGERIDWLKSAEGGGMSDGDARAEIARFFPVECGSCSPPTNGGLCDLDVLSTDASGTYSCGDRISWLQSAEGGSLSADEATTRVATEFPSSCGICACNLNTIAADGNGAYSCWQRIDWLQTAEGGSNDAATAHSQIASQHPEECGLCLLPSSSSTPPSPSTYCMVFEDDFSDAGTLGTTWTNEVNGWGGGNEEIQYYTDRRENSYVSGAGTGSLVLSARRGAYTGTSCQWGQYGPNCDLETVTKPWTSGRVTTSKKRGEGWRYGRFEARMKMPNGLTKGAWPAFWLLPTDGSPYGGWPCGGEIDVMEAGAAGTADTHSSAAIHFGGPWPDHRFRFGGTESSAPLSDDFHLFSAEWSADGITAMVDNKPFWSVTKDDWMQGCQSGASASAPFDDEFYMILNLAVGGKFPHPVDASTPDRMDLEIDYVRVWQPKDIAGSRCIGGSGATTPSPSTTTQEPEVTTTTTTVAATTTNSVTTPSPAPPVEDNLSCDDATATLALVQELQATVQRLSDQLEANANANARR